VGSGNYYDRQHGSDPLLDERGRSLKAEKILAVLTEVLGEDLSRSTCLDIGCSYGFLTKHLAPRFRYTLALEYNPEALGRAVALRELHLDFVRGDAQRLPIRDEAVDVAICAQVYEHVADSSLLFEEIWRVLAPGGICFFSGPNRLYPFEFHYRLPFVHWLPWSWTQACLKVLGRHSEERIGSMTLWGLHKRLSVFEIEDYTVAMLHDPAKYACIEEMGRLQWMSRLPLGVLRAMLPLVPNFNWILRKPKEV